MTQNNAQKEAAQRALEAAEFLLNNPNSLTLVEAAKQFGIGKVVLKCARAILLYGSEEDIKNAKNGHGLTSMYEKLKAKMPEDQLSDLKKRKGPLTDKRLEKIQTDSILWGKLSLMLQGVAELPSIDDMLKVVKANNRRETSVNQNLEVALKWLQEFNDAWTNFQSSKRQHSNPDARRGDEAA